MITLLTIEPLSDAHGALIVEAFNRFFIDRGGLANGRGDGGNGNGNGDGAGYGWGYGNGDGDGDGNGNKCPEEWRVQ